MTSARLALRHLWVGALVLGLGMVAWALLHPRTISDADVLAYVNGRPVYRAALESLRAGLSAELGAGVTVSDELERLLVDEELLVQYGESLGLLQGDPVIRRRLVQRVLDDLDARIDEPDETAIAEYFAAHATDYERPARVRFRQVMLALGSGDDASMAAELIAVRKRIRDRDGFLRVEAAWTDTLRGFDANRLHTLPEITSTFGPAFAQALLASKVGMVEGPLKSGFGLHLVWIDEIVPPERPGLATVREQVARDLRAARSRDGVQRLLARLREEADIRYTPP